MSKLKSVIDFVEALKVNVDSLQGLQAEINDLQNDPVYQGWDIGACVVIKKYADHVTAELQAENAALRAKIANLEQTILDMQESAEDDLK